jgi:hypothetical protein
MRENVKIIVAIQNTLQRIQIAIAEVVEDNENAGRY